MMNFELYKRMRQKKWRQRDLARAVGEHESITSRIISGIWNPDEERKVKYAKAWDVRVEDIFPSNGGAQNVCERM